MTCDRCKRVIWDGAVMFDPNRKPVLCKECADEVAKNSNAPTTLRLRRSSR